MTEATILTYRQRNRDKINAYRRERYAKRKKTRVRLCLECHQPLNGEWRLHLDCMTSRLKSLNIAENK